jgi:hypothetical protein
MRVRVGWITGRRWRSRLARVSRQGAGRAPRRPKVVSYGVPGCWRGPLRFLQVPVILLADT